MSHKVNLVRVLTAATGNSTPITLGTKYSNLFMTPAEAGAMDGRVYTYLIVDGNDFELGRGAYTASGTSLARTTVLYSRIAGTLGTSRITLSGTAQVRFIESAEDMDGMRGTRAVTGTSDTLNNSDLGFVVTYSNASAVAVSLAQASVSNLFLDGWAVWVKNKGAGAVTITPATSTIDGAATLVLAQNQGALIWSDGTNYQYFIFRGDIGVPVRVDAAQSLTTTQRAQARANIYAAPFDALAYNGMQINSSFEVDQTRLGGFALTGTDQYVQDGVKAKSVGWGGVVSAYPSGSSLVGYPDGFRSNVGFVSSSIGAFGTNDYMHATFPIEGYRFARCKFGTASAESVSVGFWVFTDAAGTLGVALQNSAGNRTRPQQISVPSTGWQWVTTTFPGDTSGTWLNTNGVGAKVIVCMASGSTNKGTLNSWNSDAKTSAAGQTDFFGYAANLHVAITGLIVVPGGELPSASRSSLIMRPYEDELTLCFRQMFSWRADSGAQRLGSMLADTSTTGQMILSLPRALRAAPEVSFSGITIVGTVSAAAPYGGYSIDANGLIAIGWTVSGASAGASYQVYSTGSSSYFLLDARL